MNVSSTQNASQLQPLSTLDHTTSTMTDRLNASFQSVLESTIEMIELEESTVSTAIGSTFSGDDNFNSSPTSFENSSLYSSLLSLLPNFSEEESNLTGLSSSGPTDTSTVLNHSAMSGQPDVNAPTAWSNDVQTASAKYNLPSGLLQAVIQQESGFNPNSVSTKGAMGLMQLMPDTAASLGVTDPLNPAQNINGGAKYLRQLLDQYHNNIPLALAAYNAGPGAVDKYGGVPPYAETKAYVASILGHLQSEA